MLYLQIRMNESNLSSSNIMYSLIDKIRSDMHDVIRNRIRFDSPKHRKNNHKWYEMKRAS